ncbi:MAG TPA: lauroyl acyltransferase [Alphaproteobacteria bacterium]|jgi:KDO2-lipid IV(A) lauroyltransferase
MRIGLLPLRAFQLLEAAPVWAILGLFKLLPRRAAAGLGAAVARCIGPRLPMAKVARRNIALCLPEKSEAEREAILTAMWDNLGRLAGEFTHRRALWDASLVEAVKRYGEEKLRAETARGERVRLVSERVEIVGADQFVRLLEGKKPALIFTAHMGNWEVLQWTAARMGLKFAVIYRRPNNPFIARLIEGRRGGMVEFLPKGLQGAFGAARVLENGGRLAMLVDVKENKGAAIPFFGRPAMTGTALATLALRHDALIVGTWAQRIGKDKFRITVERPLAVPRTGDHEADVRAIMSAVNARVECWVRERPEQWLWLHRRWPREAYKD